MRRTVELETVAAVALLWMVACAVAIGGCL